MLSLFHLLLEGCASSKKTELNFVGVPKTGSLCRFKWSGSLWFCAVELNAGKLGKIILFQDYQNYFTNHQTNEKIFLTCHKFLHTEYIKHYLWAFKTNWRCGAAAFSTSVHFLIWVNGDKSVIYFRTFLTQFLCITSEQLKVDFIIFDIWGLPQVWFLC